jgi:ABC-type amino acid transport substrate-binding protein
MRVGDHAMPPFAPEALAGRDALRAWYRDSTLDWVPFARIAAHPDSSLATIVEFEPDSPEAALVEPGAMRAYLAGRARAAAGDLAAADSLLARAAALQMDDGARTFRAEVAAERARIAAERRSAVSR